MIGWAIASGAVVGLGVIMVVAGARPATVRLDDALSSLSHRAPLVQNSPSSQTTRWSFHGLRLPLSAKQQRLLLMQDRPVGDFFTEKLIFSLTGLLLPGVWLIMALVLDQQPNPASPAWGLLGAIAGYFLPDLRLARSATTHRRATTDAVHTFFDLVALERLANASASQAVASAAAVSDVPLFRRITAGLERARMEQRPPWGELRAIAQEWDVPELADLADVMQLEEQGVGLAGVLQARVKELRDAHLTKQKVAAQEASEGLTIWMTIPAMLLGLAFLAPALLRLVSP
ncbi:hypothetical protein [Tessaracoccus caeni]|uniref:hypothetical protein n=1 Tax=Tessaracoccus caeni TaxID=3031239 RepID=UPI0023D9BDDA|nr:hypothetical protein [Tessaracoccus caeni]MDF1488173.1 hypothetical protein [Tessaracoccus caeni]